MSIKEGSLRTVWLISILFIASVFSYTDHVMYKRNQDTCREVTRRATRDCRWKAGLYRNVDFVALHGRIIAYQIRWFSGRWSGWFVPGINDADGKFNPYRGRCSLRLEAKSMRRIWSYFYDHEHKFILCS